MRLRGLWKVLAAAGWIVLVFCVDPWRFGIDVGDDVCRLAMVAAVVGSFGVLLDAHSKPVVEVYMAGYEAGHREGLKSRNTGRLVKFRERSQVSALR